jgi:hypothetical protein
MHTMGSFRALVPLLASRPAQLCMRAAQLITSRYCLVPGAAVTAGPLLTRRWVAHGDAHAAAGQQQQRLDGDGTIDSATTSATGWLDALVSHNQFASVRHPAAPRAQ